jgi:GNAT superfamily N-acetyltransferase
MQVRLFSPETDKVDQIIELTNEWYGKDFFKPEHFERFNPSNVIVVEEAGEIVGYSYLLDGGLPYAFLDQLYVRPRFRRFTTFRALFAFVEELCKERGIQWFCGILDGIGAESEQLVDLLKRRAQWKAQYLGERPMFCKTTGPTLSV